VIDTVEFRIHDIKYHKDLATFLDKSHLGQGRSVLMRERGDVDEWTIEQKLTHKKILRFHDTNKTHEVAHFYELKSSHYTIAYCIDINRDFIKFNVALPKYCYGTNIIHYNTNPKHKDFSFFKHSALDTNLNEAYDRLLAFFDKFFLVEFGAIKIDRAFVEINRIDLCFNQMFDSKADALEYFAQLQKVRKKFSRDSSNSSRDWKTSLTYVTPKWSFKVYHKGAEFKKHDSKKLLALNQAGQATFDVPFYQDFSDKILRYEMTFRNAYLSYLYMTRLFRKDCHIWRAGVKLYKTHKIALEKAKTENLKPGKRKGLTFAEYRKTLSPEDLRLIKYVSSFYARTKKFYLSNKGFNLEFDKATDEYNFSRWPGRSETFDQGAKLSRALFRVMAGKFLDVLSEYKLELYQDSTSVLARLESYNNQIESDKTALKKLAIPKDSPRWSSVPSKIQPGKIRIVLDLLQKQSFEEIAASNIFSRKTWYNLRQDLAKLNLNERSLNGLTNRVAFDLGEYQTQLIRHSGKFVNLSF
jgi:hypothetical protein